MTRTVSRIEQRARRAGGDELVPRADDQDADPGAVGRDVEVRLDLAVPGRVDLHAEEEEPVAEPLSHEGGALADAGRKRQSVEAAGRGRHARDGAGEPMNE